jgi:hypothetical protein
MKLSRIESGQTFMRRFKVDSVEKIRVTVVFGTVAVFVAGQVIMMALAVFKIIDLLTFQLMLASSSVFLILVWNVSTFVIYSQLTGSPYKSQDHWRKVRKLIVVCTVWTFAFFIKFTAVFLGMSMYNFNVKTSNDFWSACFFAVFTLVTETIPLFLVVDGSFAKIFTGEHLETLNENDEKLLSETAQGELEPELISSIKDSTSGHMINASEIMPASS